MSIRKPIREHVPITQIEKGTNRSIGERLRKARLLWGMTQTDVANALGISYQSWARHERRHNWMAFPPKVREGLREFHIACMHSRTAAFAVRFRLRLWLLRMNMLPMLPVPSFRTLAGHSNTLAEVLAEAMSRMYGEDVHENMLAVLGMVDLELDGLED